MTSRFAHSVPCCGVSPYCTRYSTFGTEAIATASSSEGRQVCMRRCEWRRCSNSFFIKRALSACCVLAAGRDVKRGALRCDAGCTCFLANARMCTQPCLLRITVRRYWPASETQRIVVLSCGENTLIVPSVTSAGKASPTTFGGKR